MSFVTRSLSHLLARRAAGTASVPAAVAVAPEPRVLARLGRYVTPAAPVSAPSPAPLPALPVPGGRLLAPAS